MASSSSLKSTDSAYTDSEAEYSSTDSETPEGAEEEEQEEQEEEEEEEEEIDVPVSPIPHDSTPKRRPTLTPYAHTTSNVYAASSSLLTIEGRPLSPSHSKPASADEILFHNPKDPNFTLPESVDKILRDENVTASLPDSDLLKAIHAYAADFYAAKGWDTVTGRCMDESALLAMGVLLEEWCKEMIGKDGDMVFLEREGD
ncbi:hypothetical protein TWF694_003427 [Orbilia ellipsospora]|uniref:Uncharacterized protein n=1 Tax=Orbilia ellipsospora TaxID=2528407 RepID=A0AAV9WZ69_9PEZI